MKKILLGLLFSSFAWGTVYTGTTQMTGDMDIYYYYLPAGPVETVTSYQITTTVTHPDTVPPTTSYDFTVYKNLDWSANVYCEDYNGENWDCQAHNASVRISKGGVNLAYLVSQEASQFVTTTSGASGQETIQFRAEPHAAYEWGGFNGACGTTMYCDYMDVVYSMNIPIAPAAASVNLNIGMWLENLKAKMFAILPSFTQKVHAQTSGIATTTPKATAILVANVNLTDAQLVRISDDKHTVSFALTNKGASQQEEVMYAFFFKNEGGETVHAQRFDRSITLFKNKPVFISEELVIPQGLSGTHTVLVSALTRAGLPLGTGIAGKITLETDDTPRITSCSASRKTYEQNETLPVTCTVVAKKPLASYQSNGDGYVLSTKAYYHNEQLERVSAMGELKGGTATSVLRELSTPGTYMLRSQLMTRSGVPVGKEIVTPFVINGTTVSILNLILDRNEYAKGDVAKGAFSGTIFTSEKGKIFHLTASLSGKRGPCAEDIRREMNGRSAFELVFPIAKTCSNPSLAVKITDERGTILAERALAVQSDAVSFGKEAKIGLGFLVIILIAIFVRPHLAAKMKKPAKKKSSK